MLPPISATTVYPKKYAHGFVVLCFVVVMQSFKMNSHEVFIHIHRGCFAGTGAIVRLPQCQWSKPDGYEKISQCITTTKHSKAKTVCILLGIYCMLHRCCSQHANSQSVQSFPIWRYYTSCSFPIFELWYISGLGLCWTLFCSVIQRILHCISKWNDLEITYISRNKLT